MAIFTRNNETINDDEVMSIEELTEMIDNNEINIFFSEDVFNYVTEFVVEIKGDQARSIIIRNKYLDGADGKPIEHNPSLKYVCNDEFKHGGKRGVPFEVKNEYDGLSLALGKKVQLKVSDVDKTGQKIVKTILKEESPDLYKYWYLNPENPEQYEEMKSIETRILNKYSKRRF